MPLESTRIYKGGVGKQGGFPGGSAVKNLPAMQEPQEMQVWPLGREDPLEEGMATHSNILAWRIPWTEEPRGLQSIGWQRGQISIHALRKQEWSGGSETQ